MAKGRGLGKGLDSLISSKYTEKTETSENKNSSDSSSASVNRKDESKAAANAAADKKENTNPVPAAESSGQMMMKLSSIEPNRNQPRKDFDESALNELSESVKKHGVLQPILVRKAGKRYEIIAGERRWRAAKLARLKEIPVIVKEFDDGEATEIALIENIQREDLNPVEEARAYQRLMDEFYLTQEQVADRVGKSRAAIANRVRLLKLVPEVLDLLTDEKLTEGHARALISLEIPQMQIEAAKEVIERGLTVRETEKLVKRYLKPGKPHKKEEFSEADILAYQKLEEELKYSTGTKVEIHRSNRDRGKIILDYYSMEELERLAGMLRRFKEV